jgi:D-alanyl-lipoteichoic acid acyltransferase DltB (MBOAT superfamily)
MLFQTFEFTLFFLITVILIHFTKGYIQRIILLCTSLFFYAYGSIQHLFVFIFVIIITYLFGILIEKRRNRIIFSFGILLSIIPLFIFKYSNFILSQIFSNNILFYIIKLPPPPPVISRIY